MENQEKGKWKLHIGCHRGTLVSRDSDVRTHDSLEACQKDVAESEAFWAGFGYFVWFAEAKSPNGENIKLHPGTHYQS